MPKKETKEKETKEKEPKDNEPKEKETKEKETKEKKEDESNISNINVEEEHIKKSENKEWVVAFDPGKINFAFIIEEIDTDMLENLVCPNKKDRFFNNRDIEQEKKKRKKREDLEPTDSYVDFLEKFYHCGKTILCSNNNITDTNSTDSKKKGSKALDVSLFLRLTDLLDKHKYYFDQCSTIIIEQQMSFGARINTMAIKIAQHTYSYFLFRYRDTKKIIEFPSYNKTQILGAPGGLEKPKRKKWAIEKADEIWTLRGDLSTSMFVGSKKKKDDMSDCLLHVLSYIITDKF